VNGVIFLMFLFFSFPPLDKSKKICHSKSIDSTSFTMKNQSHPLVKQFIQELNESSLSEKERGLVLHALEFALDAHDGQKRKSGEPVLIHPVGVGLRLLQKFAEPVLVSAGLLHDTVEDCEHITMKMIYDEFGDEIGFLVDAVTKKKDSFYKKDIVIEDKIERLLWAGLQDVRVLVLKIADRENNLETLKYLKNNKQIRMAFETQAIYLPLRKLLCFDCPQKVCTQECFEKFLKESGFTSAKQIKEYLIKKSFENFDSEMFGLVYGDTANVVWEISDIEAYKKLCNNKIFDKTIKVKEMSGSPNWFQVLFTFEEGFVMPETIKMRVSY